MIVFVGGGNMATALIGGMVARGGAATDFHAVEPMPEQRARLSARFPGISASAAPDAGAISRAELVVLAVKPQQMRAAALALAPSLRDLAAPGPVVLTIAAGIRLADLARWLGGFGNLVRAMPNTPALVGKGISGIYAAAGVDAHGRALAAGVLEAVGEILWVGDEAMLDAVTGISGSGPAYVFYFLEALEAAAGELGFAPAEARKLAYATFSGAIALAQASAEAPAMLRAQVTSKGGTTERALSLLEADAVKASIVAAAKAAAQRAQELGDALGGEA
jgi:pyrroline-5-carboxylate reductase